MINQPHDKPLWRSVICMANIRPLLFTNEVRCAIALLVGLALCRMSYKAGYGITRTTGGGIAAALGGLLYIYRSLRRLREGGQLEIETFRDHLKDKTYIVTGGARGIGWSAVLLLCEGGAKTVVLAIRDCDKRKAEVLAKYEAFRKSRLGNSMFESSKHITQLAFVEFDACSRASMAACAKQLLERQTHYDGILLNAGTSKAHEALEVNWINQTVLIELLKGHVKRIVTLSSIMHAIGNLKSDLATTKDQHSLVVYGTGKLAMLLEARYQASLGVEAVSAHPGYVYTDMTSFFSLLGFPACLSKSPRSGAMTPIACLIWPEIKPGAYYDTLREAPQFKSAKSDSQYSKFLAFRKEYIEKQ